VPLGAIPGHGSIALPVRLPSKMPTPSRFPIQALVGTRLSDHAVLQVN
jgi:hypothetical protein